MSTFDGADILDEVAMYLQRFVSYPSKHACFAHALWLAHIHLMDCWDSTPRLAFLSAERMSGKTRALEISSLLAKDALLSVNVSPAYLVRKVSECQPTILYDEVDNLFASKTPEVADVRALINGGHRRGAFVGRCVVRGKTVETEELPSFASVALAGIGTLPDTVGSRSIIINMRRRAPNEHVHPYRSRKQADAAAALKTRLSGWCQQIKKHIDLEVELPAQIADRDADCWEPLFAIAEQAEGDWPIRVKEAAISLLISGQDHVETEGTRLLADLRDIFETNGKDKIPTETLLLMLENLPESPWKDIKGKPLNDRGLSQRLKPYGVKSKDVNVGGNKCKKGYTRESLADAWNRYLGPKGDEGDERDNIDNNNKNIADIADIADGSQEPALHNGNGHDDLEMPTFLDRRNGHSNELGHDERISLMMTTLGMSREEAETEANKWRRGEDAAL
jgi:hypothetical protein